MRTLFLLLTAFIAMPSPGQDKKEKLLSETSASICTCIGSINSYNKSKKDVSSEIKECIDQQAVAYQLGAKLAGIDTSAATINPETGKKEVNLSLNLNKDSKEYKEYYYAIERYLMSHCEAIKVKIASNDKHNTHSLSENRDALDLYYKGIAESKAGNHQKAIELYESALRIDSIFAFAWDNMGIAYRRLGQYDKAIWSYNKSLEVDPTGAMPLQNIAIVYQYKKEYQKAIDAYMRYKEVDSTNAEVYYGIGQIYAFNLQNHELGLDNICKAYNMYIENNSPYRTDAEKLVQYIYQEMKKAGKEDKFHQILKENHITPEKKNSP